MKLKKLIVGVIVIGTILIMRTVLTYAADDISVMLNGTKLNFDVSPRFINDRTMVPMRVIFEALNASVEWDDETETVTAAKGDTVIKLTIDDSVMYINGAPITLDAPATLIDGSTLVPVRAVSEAFKLNVDWDNETQTVIMSSLPSDGTVIGKTDEQYNKLRNYVRETGTLDNNGCYAVSTIISGIYSDEYYFDEYMTITLRDNNIEISMLTFIKHPEAPGRYDQILKLYEDGTNTLEIYEYDTSVEPEKLTSNTYATYSEDGAKITKSEMFDSYGVIDPELLDAEYRVLYQETLNTMNVYINGLLPKKIDIGLSSLGFDIQLGDFGINYVL